MTKLIINTALRRFIEILCSCIALSALISLLCAWGILPDRSNDPIIGLYVAVVLFVIINIKMMRSSYCELRSYKLYFVVNFCAYAVFVLINLVAYKLFSATLYTWLFAITKAGRYTSFHLSKLQSAAVFHLLMGIVTLLAPTGLGWIKEAEAEEEEMLERLPGMLDVNLSEQKSDSKETAPQESKEEIKKDNLP